MGFGWNGQIIENYGLPGLLIGCPDYLKTGI